MSDRFCTQCGEHIGWEDRFCIYCGAATAGPETESGSSSSRTGTTPGARKTVPSPIQMPGSVRNAALPEDDQDEPEDDKEDEEDQDEPEDDEEDKEGPYVITEHDLNYLIVCSYRNAPLDSYILLVREKESGLRWIPALLVHSLEDRKVIACAQVYYSIGWKENGIADFCLEETGRDELSDEVCDAIDMLEETMIQVSLVFEPMRHDDLDNQIPSKWEKTVDEYRNVRFKAIMHLPIPGHVLKRKLEKHETFLKEIIEEFRKPREVHEKFTQRWLAESETILAQLDRAKESLPDGAADHAYCLGHAGHYAIVKLTDELNEEGGPNAAAFRAPSAVRAAQALRSRNALPLKSRPTRSTIARPEGPPHPGPSDSGTGQDVLRRVKKIFRSDS
jgi:hypothetical protein